MPKFSIQAESAKVSYTVARSVTEDGSDAVFKNLSEARLAAEQWVATLNAESYADATDWTVAVVKS